MRDHVRICGNPGRATGRGDPVAAQKLGNATVATEPGRAAELWDLLLLSEVHGSGLPWDTDDLLQIPCVIHRARGLAYLKHGQADEAWREFAAHQRILPDDIGLAEDVVPLLEQAGQAARADEMFGRAFDRGRSLCVSYPQASDLHNNLAWLAARCHRQLDEALTHARKSLYLEPDNAAYLDTLAEVHFHRGDRAAAVQYARRAVELAPRNQQLAARLQRFEHDPLPGKQSEE